MVLGHPSLSALDSVAQIATESILRKQHQTARQSLIHLLTGNNGRGGLAWLYWPQHDVFGTLVLW
jgi:hypothetical protein